MIHRLILAFSTGLVVCASLTSLLAAEKKLSEARLQQLFKAYPDADANKDGKLTIEEAKAYNAAHPELRWNRQADAKGKADEADDGTVSAQVLALYEAREFKGVKYRLLKPIELAKNPDPKYPLILSLHGAGGIGNDNVRNLREWCTTLAQEELRRKHPCFVVAPQTFGFWRTPAMTPHYTDVNIAKLSADWQATIAGHRKRLQDPEGANLDRVFLLLDALAKEFPIDTNRVYVLGHSGGGFGTWTAVADQPDRFAAAITSAGWLAPWCDASAVKDVPIWSFQGARDKTSQVSLGHSTFERMKAVGANMKFTEVANIGHGVGGVAFTYTGDSKENTGVTKYASDRCDKTPDVWGWLFSKKRAEAIKRAAVAEPPKPVDPESLVDKVSITLGKELTIEFKRDGDRLLQPSQSNVANADKAVVTIKLEVTESSPVPPPREGATRPYLHVDNHFDRTLHYRALARLKGSKEFFPIAEDLKPIPVGEGANKCWGFDTQLEEVVLYDFKLSDQRAK